MGVRTFLGKVAALPKLLSYNKEAERFWERKREMLTDTLYSTLVVSPDKEVRNITKRFAKKLSFPELDCDKSEIKKFNETMRGYGKRKFVSDVIESGSNTDLIKMLTVPGLIAIDGMGIMREKGENLLGAFCYLSLSSDMGDEVLDNEVPHPKDPLIPYENWKSAYKIIAAGAFDMSEAWFKTMDERIQERVERGIKRVSEAEKQDIKYRGKREVPLDVIDEIYDGKIAEIEATIFSSLNILGGSKYPTLEDGARYLADEAQIVDDNKDLLGEDEKEPTIPNPSYWLTFFRNNWRKEPRDAENLEQELEEVMKKASVDTKTKGMEYHVKVLGEYEKLNAGFKTKHLLEFIVGEVNKKLNDTHDTFMSGETFGALKPQLKELVLTE